MHKLDASVGPPRQSIEKGGGVRRGDLPKLMSRGLAVSRPARQALPLVISAELPTRPDRSRSAVAAFTVNKKITQSPLTKAWLTHIH